MSIPADKLTKILGAMTSENDGFALNATRAFFKEAAKQGLSLQDLACRLSNRRPATANDDFVKEDARVKDVQKEDARQVSTFTAEEASIAAWFCLKYNDPTPIIRQWLWRLVRKEISVDESRLSRQVQSTDQIVKARRAHAGRTYWDRYREKHGIGNYPDSVEALYAQYGEQADLADEGKLFCRIKPIIVTEGEAKFDSLLRAKKQNWEFEREAILESARA